MSRSRSGGVVAPYGHAEHATVFIKKARRTIAADDVPRVFDDACIRELVADSDHRVDAAQVREPGVHQGDVRAMLAEPLNGFRTVGCLRYQRHVRLAVDHGGDAFAEKRMIVHTEYSNFRFFAHSPFAFSAGFRLPGQRKACPR